MSNVNHWKKVNSGSPFDDSLETSRPSNPIPHIPKDLIEDLDRRFPPRCPSPDDHKRLIWMYAGKRELIEVLKESHRRQVSASMKGFTE